MMLSYQTDKCSRDPTDRLTVDESLRAWCRERIPELAREVTLLRRGAIRTYADKGSGFKDTSQKTMERLARELTELEELLATG